MGPDKYTHRHSRPITRFTTGIGPVVSNDAKASMRNLAAETDQVSFMDRKVI